MSAPTTAHPAAAYHRRRGAETEAKIRAAAVALLAKGVAYCTVERVAERAGVAKTSIYRRYANSQALALDVVMPNDEYAQLVLDEIGDAVHRIVDEAARVGELPVDVPRSRAAEVLVAAYLDRKGR